jgi:pyruvate/2-oxoglutarate/acetoin dehydrogenase E1 component
MVDVARAASDAARDTRGASVGVVDLRTLRPFDTETIVRAAEHLLYEYHGSV